MASATDKPQKKLRDFLNEQQEPFILEVYLSERGCSRKWSLNGDSGYTSDSCDLNKRRKALLCKALTILHNKLGFHSENNILTRDHDKRRNHASVSEPEFSSCPNMDEGTSSHRDHNSFSSHIFQTSNACNKRWQKQRCIEGNPESLRKIPLHNVNEERSSHVILNKNITEDSMLSAAIWSLEELLPEPDVSKKLKSKRVLHKIKKHMLFDCVKDITMNFPTTEDKKHDYRQFMGLEIGERICLGTEDRGQHGGAGANSMYTMDYLNSMIEWSNFEPHVTEISVYITDAIMESMKNEIVSEMIGTLAPNL